jgi:PIN domain nuclease of toxin-antitoxin system
MDAWLDGLARAVRTVGLSPAVAAAAVRLPDSFPADPADRLIFATAVERGWKLVTKDAAIRKYPHPAPIAVW